MLVIFKKVFFYFFQLDVFVLFDCMVIINGILMNGVQKVFLCLLCILSLIFFFLRIYVIFFVTFFSLFHFCFLFFFFSFFQLDMF
jgi:hypothetical protein